MECGASTPPFVSVVMTLKTLVLTLRHTPVLPSHHPLDAPHTMLRRPQCCAPFVFILLVSTPSTCMLVLQTTRDKSINDASWDGSIRLLERREKTRE